MPIPINLPPYPTAEDVLQLARVLCLDAGVSIQGDLLADAGPGIQINAAAQVGLVVTITTNQVHNLNVGQVVDVENVSVAGYNGKQTIQTVPAANQFTYSLAAGGLGAGVGGTASPSPSQGFLLLNSAYRYVQDKIANQGYETPIAEAVLKNLTAVPAAVRDPATRVYVGYDVYFDGNANNTPAVNGTPVLPADLLIPLVVKERVSGQAANFRDMGMANDGLSLRMQLPYLGEWDWRNDRLYLVGATQTLDLWLRYQSFFADVAQPTDQIRIFHGGNAVAYTLANRFTNPRGGDVGGHFMAERDEEIRQIVMRSAHKNVRKNIRRQPYGGGHASGWNN
jgi:hypothetical protein